MEYPNKSHAANILSASLLANLEQLGGQRFCTEAQPSHLRLEWLKEVIDREYANVDIATSNPETLFNEMFIYPWKQGLRLSPIRSNAIQIEKLPQEPEHISQDCYFGVLLTAGQYKLEQGGREVFLKAGDMTLYDATESHRITTPGHFSKVLISIPRRLLVQRIPNISKLTATRLSTKQGAGAISASMLASTANQLGKLDHVAFQGLAEPALELFSLALQEVAGVTKPVSHHRRQALVRTKQFIADNLTESELTAKDIATAMGLSIRYINNLFNQENTSLMRYLTQQRLLRSRHFLASSLYSYWSITDIAMQAGFSNMSHFSRVFSQAYGMSPRAYRYQCLK